MRSEWIFETVKSMKHGSVNGNANGTAYRSLAHLAAMQAQAGMPPGMIPDDDASFYDDEGDTLEGLAPIAESEDSYDSSAATKGSGEMNRLGSNEAASHSTVIIKPVTTIAGRRDAFGGDGEEDAEEEANVLGAPPAYDTPGATREPSPVINGTHSSNSPPPSPNTARRRSTFAERTLSDGRGTQLRPADLGNGIDTIRPVKRVDAAGSLKLSAEYVGQIREGANGTSGSGSSGESADGGANGGKGRKRRGSENARAGRAMLDEVVVPVFQNVRDSSERQFCA